MNIAFVYEFGQEVWSTPSSLMEEFKSRGHVVDRYYLSETGMMDFLASNKKYDLILSLDWKGLHLDRLSKNKIDSVLIAELADCPQNLDRHRNKLGHFHAYLCPDYQSTETLKQQGHNAFWFNHFADSKIHHAFYSTPKDTFSQKIRSTRGAGGSQFMDYLSQLMPNKFLNRNGLTGLEYGAFLNNGKIVLQNSRWGEITRRIFEGMACHRLVITDRLSEDTHISELFKEDLHIVYYDNMADCISKLNYYMSTEADNIREEIEIQGHMKVLENHTQVQRVHQILQIYNNIKS